MAFKSKTVQSIGTSATQVSDTVSASTTHTIIGLSMANRTASNITGSATVTKSGGSATYVVKDATIAQGGALIAVGGDQKIVLEAGDIIEVTSDTASSIDTVISYLSSST